MAGFAWPVQIAGVVRSVGGPVISLDLVGKVSVLGVDRGSIMMSLPRGVKIVRRTASNASMMKPALNAKGQ